MLRAGRVLYGCNACDLDSRIIGGCKLWCWREPVMYDLTRLADPDLILIRRALVAAIGGRATSMEAVAGKIVNFFYTQFRDSAADVPACALVRCYVTQRYEQLEPRLQPLVRRMFTQPPQASMKCLTLLASAGDRPEWNDRTRSLKHQVMPLPSEAMVSRYPMIARMFQQFGIKLSALVAEDAAELHMLEHRTHNIFYVPDAAGSPYIPAQQEFVLPYGIKSVVGMGGILPYGNLFAVILFAKVPIPQPVIKHFASLAVDIKMALVPFGDKKVFEEPGSPPAAR
jgi:hypothetical protein